MIFYRSCQCVVVRQILESRRVVVALLKHEQSEKALTMGDVGIPGIVPRPAVGAVVEVLYLHEPKPGHQFNRPLFHGVRADVPMSECTVQQLAAGDE